MKIVVFVFFLSAHCELTAALSRKHFYFSNRTTWTQAQSHCRGYYADLSSLDSWEEITALNNASGLSGSYGSSWVGLIKISANNWEWTDGGNGSFIPWGPNQPNEIANNLCAQVNNSELSNYPCTDSYPYFCYRWATKLIVVKENKSWEEALEYCRTHHTDLASLPTYLHRIQANQTIANTSTVWTGLRFMAGSWFWLRGGVNLKQLRAQLPACPANYTYCGSLNMTTQRWENRNCMEKLNFVCY